MRKRTKRSTSPKRQPALDPATLRLLEELIAGRLIGDPRALEKCSALIRGSPQVRRYLLLRAQDEVAAPLL